VLRMMPWRIQVIRGIDLSSRIWRFKKQAGV
jgi:hypothetical protein